MQYGFSSFYHRDKAYLVLITIWQNALTQNPLSVESLRQELKTLKVTKEQEQLIMDRRSKSASFTSEGSVDLDPESSVTSVAESISSLPPPNSSSDTITNPTEESEEEGSVHTRHARHAGFTSSSHSSDESAGSGSDRGSCSSRTGDSDQDDEEVDSQHESLSNSGMPRSPSLVTLRSETPSGGVADGTGGSPNIFHHWKQTWNFTSAWRRVTLIKPLEVVRKPIHTIGMCSPTQLINVFISIA